MSLRWKVAVLTGLVAAATVVPGRPAAASGRGHLWQRVSFGGVSLRVPASWPVIRFSRQPSACPRLDVHAVYLGTPGPDPSCPARLIGRAEAVMIGPLRVLKRTRDEAQTIAETMLRKVGMW